MTSFHFELVSPERLLFTGEVQSVSVPGVEGAFTVLNNHAPVMSTLKPGLIEIDETPTKKVRIFVRGGFADVSDKGLTILAERAIPFEELDATRIAAQVKDAEEDLADAMTDEGRRLASERLAQLQELRAALQL